MNFSPQQVFVNGNNFQPGPGFRVLLGFPGGGEITLTGGQLQNVTPNSFQFTGVFSTPGAYSITVNNQVGPPSNTFVFTVN